MKEDRFSIFMRAFFIILSTIVIYLFLYHEIGRPFIELLKCTDMHDPESVINLMCVFFSFLGFASLYFAISLIYGIKKED